MRVTFENLHFLIEGPGPAMTLATEWLAERREVLARNSAICKELGITQYHSDRDNGVLSAAVFPKGDGLPGDWRKPNKHGLSWPKKGSPWIKRLKDQVGHRRASDVIRDGLSVPTILEMTKPDGMDRREGIGHWFHPCQFATNGPDAPYLLVIPNVAYYVAQAELKGWTVQAGAKTFQPVFQGCRAIQSWEWELLKQESEVSQ